MTNSIEEVIRIVQSERPHFVIAVPPTDNRRMLVMKGTMRRFLTKGAREYIKEYAKLRPLVPKPPVVLCYKAYFRREWRDKLKTKKYQDPANIIKCMLDALYKDDDQVYPWCFPPGVDKDEPRVELWIKKLWMKNI
jgi:Holliday junction resolvase RusA-like endonuclease